MTARIGIDRLEFTKEGFEELRIEVKVLAELVGEMARLLTEEQRSAINDKQNSRIMPQADYEKLIQRMSKDLFGLERSVRIGRLLT